MDISLGATEVTRVRPEPARVGLKSAATVSEAPVFIVTPGAAGADLGYRLVWGELSAIGLDLSPVVGFVAGLAEDGLDLVWQKALNASTTARIRRIRFAESLGGHSKRYLDIAVAGTGLMVLSPLMVIIAALIRADMGAPVLFAHKRVGFGGRTFQCLKFRTMLSNADEVLARHLADNPDAAREWSETQKLKNDPRVTPLGRLLRKSSLDELPQLFNVLVGDMSCVGPRPIVTAELQKYGPHARHYLRARPGITGTWQVSGRSTTSYRRRVVMDTQYVRQWSVAGDVLLMARTLPAVLRTSDAV